ncbi:MAG: ferritin-like domain-containing protein [Alistipes senegalensis]|nr:ferritin-like domain-containing protein [Bacteroides cellulosilyticus]MCM1351500.1 ferritin-like domain-containing protein [Alistipes senegalensis]
MKTYDNDEKEVKTGTNNSRKSATKTKASASSKPGTASKKKSSYTGDAVSDFHTFFVDALKDIYWAEEHLKTGLRKMCEASTSSELAAAFKKHYNEGDGQLAELESIFSLLGEKAEGKKCEAMAGLLKEAEEIIEDTKRNSFVRDAGLILAAQKVEHYEIATYGTLRALAVYLPEKKIQKLLDTILAEEKKTDVALTKLAEAFVNECAAVE